MESSPEKEVFSEEETEQEGVGTPSHALPRGPVSLPCHGNATLTGVTVSSQKCGDSTAEQHRDGKQFRAQSQTQAKMALLPFVAFLWYSGQQGYLTKET